MNRMTPERFEQLLVANWRAGRLEIWGALIAERAEVERLQKEIAGYESNERSINEALNRGDGAYRP